MPPGCVDLSSVWDLVEILSSSTECRQNFGERPFSLDKTHLSCPGVGVGVGWHHSAQVTGNGTVWVTKDACQLSRGAQGSSARGPAPGPMPRER